jgi:hypothetical protein
VPQKPIIEPDPNERTTKMGDRASIYITSEQFEKPIRLYGHYSGEDNIKAVEYVLTHTNRVGDPSYLAAQIFHQFAIELGNYTGNLGFGISVASDIDHYDDNPPVIVNADTGKIEYEPREE